MQFIVFGPAFASPGDEVSVAAEIRLGDLIQFVRLGPTTIELRHAKNRPEQCYRVERGDQADTIALYAIAAIELKHKTSQLEHLTPPLHGLASARGADLSSCRSYRYRLWRTWDDTRPLVLFVGLNPSKADENHDDPTVRRCIGFAREWGYGGVEVANLYAYRATDPRELLAVADPIGPDNDSWLTDLRSRLPIVVVAWGAHPMAQMRAAAVLETLNPVHCLGITKDGHPRHPLYVKRGTPLRAWSA